MTTTAPCRSCLSAACECLPTDPTTPTPNKRQIRQTVKSTGEALTRLTDDVPDSVVIHPPDDTRLDTEDDDTKSQKRQAVVGEIDTLTLLTGNRGVPLPGLLADLEAWFQAHIHTRSEDAYIVLALWTVHTHVLDQQATTPRVAVTSPVPGCGKTTVLEHLERLTPNPLMGSHATPALIARVVGSDRPTLLLDETDNLLDPKREGVGDLVSILNSGYRKGGVRPTLIPAKGGGWDVSELPTYAAVALAGIGDHLPDSLRTRCIVIELDRAQPGEIQHTDWDEIEPQAHALRDQVTAWAEQGLTTPKPKIDGLHGREREVWLPLLHVAAAAGDDYLARARTAYRNFVDDANDNESLRPQSQQVQLLADLRAIHDDLRQPADFVASSELADLLADHNPDTFGMDARYGQIKPKRLARLMNGYGLKPIRNTTGNKRGYYWAHIREHADRYQKTSERHTT